MVFLLLLVYRILQVYSFIVIAGAILSWLVAFGVINTSNDAARGLIRLIGKVTEPVYGYIRRVIPPMGGLDLSPLILLVGIQIFQYVVLDPLLTRAFFY
jgi:YggT family protein